MAAVVVRVLMAVLELVVVEPKLDMVDRINMLVITLVVMVVMVVKGTIIPLIMLLLLLYRHQIPTVLTLQLNMKY